MAWGRRLLLLCSSASSAVLLLRRLEQRRLEQRPARKQTPIIIDGICVVRPHIDLRVKDEPRRLRVRNVANRFRLPAAKSTTEHMVKIGPRSSVACCSYVDPSRVGS